ncbi:MAG: ABC transporter substrate-binding protein, partial [Bacteroidota bacterium]
LFLFCWCIACEPQKGGDTPFVLGPETRIVSVNGALTEILCEAGYANNLVGLDITSTYPDSIQHLPKVGMSRRIPAEGVVSLQPDILIGRKDDLKPEVLEQIKLSGCDIWLFEQRPDLEGTKALIATLSDSLKMPALSGRLAKEIDTDLSMIEPIEDTPTVLFVYARGAGSMSVAGNGTQVQEMIKMAGGKNVSLDFDDFKPLSTEVLVQANPDVILMFNSGLNSISGAEGLMDIPGVSDTEAGKNQRFITMDGAFLTNFGPRVGEAARALNLLLKESMQPKISTR